MRAVAVLAIGVLAAASAGAASRDPQAALTRLLDGRVAGEPVRCIDLGLTHQVEIVPGVGLLYRSGADRLYLNRPDGADRLERGDLLATRTPGSRLCRLDLVRLVNRAGGYQRGFVSLNDFVPYTRR